MFSFLCLTESNNLSGRTTGTIEIYHAVCLINCSKRLLSPFTRIVGSLVANRYTNCTEFHCFRVKNGRGISPPKCFKSGGDFHPFLFVTVDHNGFATEFNTPIESNIYGVFFTGEKFQVIHASAFRSSRPGSEHFGFPIVRGPFAPLESILQHGGHRQRCPCNNPSH